MFIALEQYRLNSGTNHILRKSQRWILSGFWNISISTLTMTATHMRTENAGKARKVSSLKSFYKYLYRNDRIPQNILDKIEMPKVHEKRDHTARSGRSGQSVGFGGKW